MKTLKYSEYRSEEGTFFYGFFHSKKVAYCRINGSIISRFVNYSGGRQYITYKNDKYFLVY